MFVSFDFEAVAGRESIIHLWHETLILLQY